jgi:DME family drug/metabolite transporter
MGNGVAYCISWVAFFSGARILGATRASMITLFEPALAALFAWIIFGENFTPLQWLGFGVVLAALFLFEKMARRKA